MNYNLTYKQFSECAILIEWSSLIDENILQDIINFKKSLAEYYIKQKVEIINTYNSLLIIYCSTIDNIYNEFTALKILYSQINNQEELISTTWEVPVCYDDEFGIDLESFSENKNLSKSEIIKLHSQQIYTIYFIGFLPGFLYLGGLDKSLHFDRKSSPNLNIKKGAVGIGGKQTGIYPQNSPGGWHIIGNSPIHFFDSKKQNPCFAKPGDKIKFQPISKDEYESILNAVEHSEYQIKSIQK